MKIVVHEKQAFLHIRDDIFLCLGDQKEVQRANPIKLAKIVMEAMALSDFNNIKGSEGHVVN